MDKITWTEYAIQTGTLIALSRKGVVHFMSSVATFLKVLIWQLKIPPQLKTRWLYCVECPQYSTRLEALGYLCDCVSGRVQR